MRRVVNQCSWNSRYVGKVLKDSFTKSNARIAYGFRPLDMSFY